MSEPEPEPPADPDAEIKAFFDKVDEDGSGKIGRPEFKLLCADINPEMEEADIEAALLELDANGDGEISYAEFRAWWKSMEEPEPEAPVAACARRDSTHPCIQSPPAASSPACEPG